MRELSFPAVIVLLVVAGLAAWDGVYYHLWRFRLFAHDASRTEHLTHTLRALLAGPLALMLFVVPVHGPSLWLALGLAVLDFAILVWDVFSEEQSRRALGGIPPAEYRIHVVAATLHAIGLTLAFAARPASAWHPMTSAAEPLPADVVRLGMIIVPGAIALGLLHLALLQPTIGRRVDAWLGAPRQATTA